MAQLKSGSTVGGTEIAKKDLSNVATLPGDVVAQLRGTDGTNGTNGTNGTTPTFSVSGDTLNITT